MAVSRSCIAVRCFSTRLRLLRGMTSMFYSSLFCDELQKGNKWPYKGFPALEAIMREVLTECAEPAAIWSVKTSDLVYTSVLRQKDGTLYLHFLNGNGAPRRPLAF